MSASGSPPDATVGVAETAGATRLLLAGEIDAGVADDAAEAIQRIAATDGPVEIDLAAVTFMDCYGLRIIQAVVERVSAPVRVVAASDPVRFLLEAAGLAALTTDDPVADAPGTPGPVDLRRIAPLAVDHLYASEPLVPAGLSEPAETAEPAPVGTARTEGGPP